MSPRNLSGVVKPSPFCSSARFVRCLVEAVIFQPCHSHRPVARIILSTLHLAPRHRHRLNAYEAKDDDCNDNDDGEVSARTVARPGGGKITPCTITGKSSAAEDGRSWLHGPRPQNQPRSTSEQSQFCNQPRLKGIEIAINGSTWIRRTVGQ